MGAVTAGTRNVLLCTSASVLGGAEQMMLALGRGLPDLGWRPTIAFHGNRDLADAARRADISIAPSPRFQDSWGGVRLLLPWLVFLRKTAPDVVHVHLPWPFATRAPIIAALGLRIPVVLTVHGFPSFEASRRDVVVWRLLVDHSARCLAVSDDTASQLVGRLGWNSERVEVVRPGIDAERFRETVADPALRAELVPPGCRRLLLYVGRLDRLKGVETLLLALEDLPGHALAVVGDGPARHDLEQQARELAPRVTFVGARQDVEAFMAVADVLVLPSETEGLPVVVLEAMAAELPVVATRVGGVPELVLDGATGLLVSPGDAAALTRAIGRLADDTTLCNRLVAAAHERVSKSYTVDRMVRETAAAYAVARRNRTRPIASRTAARSSAVDPNDE